MDIDDTGRSGNDGKGSVFTVKDWVGLGEVFGHLKDILLWFLNSRKRHFDNEARELRNQRLGLENAAFFADLAKNLGSTDQEIRKALFYKHEGASGRYITANRHIEKSLKRRRSRNQK